MSIEGDTYEVRLGADLSSPSKARDFVRDHLVAHGADHLVEDIRLVASELATNAVRHAGSAFTVGLDVGDHDVRLWVWDSSPSAPTKVAGDPMGAGGRGLALVEVLSSQWGVALLDGSKTVWATFDSDGPTGAALH